MTRSERMAPVQRVFADAERDRARALGEAQQRLTAAEARATELRNYHADYLRSFQQRAAGGHSVTALRDFQAFLARLEQALAQQDKIVAQAREQVAQQRRSWQGAARQVKAVDSVVERWQGEERIAGERREQKDTDERAQRSALRARSVEGQ
jgi:flagellar FliJ protein